jgi:NitT/TauT family transport system substrate-binding protein
MDDANRTDPGIMTSALRIVLAAINLLAAIVLSVHATFAADKVKVSLGATDDPVYLPFFIALDKGYYQRLDLDVEIVYVGGGIATPGLISGSLDFSTSTGSAVSAILAGATLKVIMNLSESVPWKLWSTQPSIRFLADLKGKPVGVQTRGDLFELSMRAALAKAGLDGDSVVYLGLGFGSGPRLAAIQSGSLPGVLLTHLEEKIAREKGMLGRARMLIDLSKELQIPNNGLATSNKLLAKDPSIVERFVRGTLMGVRDMKAQPDSAFRIFAQRVPDVSPALLRESIEETAAVLLRDGMTNLSTQQSEIALRSSLNSLSDQPVPGASRVFDYSIVMQATEKLNAEKWAPAE